MKSFPRELIIRDLAGLLTLTRCVFRAFSCGYGATQWLFDNQKRNRMSLTAAGQFRTYT